MNYRVIVGTGIVIVAMAATQIVRAFQGAPVGHEFILFYALALPGQVAFLIGAPGWPSVPGRFLLVVGAACNATVVLANGGYMPVIGAKESHSSWVIATSDHHFLWLADRFWGASIGDFFLLSGMLLTIGLPLLAMAKARRVRRTIAWQVSS